MTLGNKIENYKLKIIKHSDIMFSHFNYGDLDVLYQ